MKPSPQLMQKIVDRVFVIWKSQNLVTFKADEKKVRDRAVEAIKAEYAKEDELDKAVHKMMDELEKQHGPTFQRSKMFPMLKKKLAQEKKIVL